MVFSSVVFLFYFLPVILILYYIVCRRSIRLRNFSLLVGSLLFYAWGEPQYVLLLILMCLWNWAAAFAAARTDRWAKAGLIVSLSVDLGVLFCFKYWDFAAGSLNNTAGMQVLPLTELALPIGISFYIFQSISYVVDVYRKDVAVQRNPLYVMLYIALFPQLIAGPIVRYSTIEKQILGRTHSRELFCTGCVRFVQGLARKLLLANAFAVMADNIFEMTRAGHQLMKIPVTLAWLGSFAYTLQIFHDFSAYSDMAIGLGQMFGFQFEENFRYPYTSQTIGEFWRRWHISLGTWFREYVYIPLGGSRVENKNIMIRNMFVVWSLTGLWHGAAWNFLFWGLWNFLFLIMERLVDLEHRSVSVVWRHVYVMLMVNMGWVLFRCEGWYQFQEYLGNMFWQNQNGFFSSYTWMFLREYALVWAAGIFLCMPLAGRVRSCIREKSRTADAILYPAGMLLLAAAAVVTLSRNGYNPLIYFNF